MIGAVGLALALLADWIGLSEGHDGFGRLQVVGIVLGFVLVGVGIVLARRANRTV